MEAWFVAKTKPRQEAQTAQVLLQRGLETYFPIVPSSRRRSVESQEPLFPGYLFVRLDAQSPDWVLSRSAPGVAYFLGSEGCPTPLPDGLLEEIRQRVEQQFQHRAKPAFRTGDRVAIVGGPMDGFEGIFDGTLSPAGRSRVLVSIVGRLATINVDVSYLRQVG